MSKSTRFSQLKSRLSFLEKKLLPSASPTGHYTKIEQDLIRSFVILAHAEIESYFEDIAKEKVTKALKSWMATRKRSSCLKAVLAYSGNELSYEKTPKNDSNNISYRLNKAVKHYLNQIQNNHGIKEKNILSILIPLGIDIIDIDPVWLSTMEMFGNNRGFFAHCSMKVQTQVDRNTEVNRINQFIIPEIERLDHLICKLI